MDRENLSDADIDHTVELLNALRRWRETDQQMRQSTQSDMNLGENDMKALRFLIAAQANNRAVTPTELTHHLGISSASTTKLLDRLAASGHVTRNPHPRDRRAVLLTVTAESHRQIRATLGSRHSQMFDVAARLSPENRDTIIHFLTALSDVNATDPPDH
ncbi:MarR family transcriptional regulator [Klugiella xanthotipulae]|uniref:MarR family transcriptional regulator n=2 Tax=Klugiella xanthotipulae TaxID=244735 RepID=A0A543HZ04_9MICO|nr:MarR family transcriptional regulator [Klugiella xanthotipulae]